MKWGRQKPPSSSSSSSYSSSSIFRVFPISWLLKFKQTSMSSEPDSSISKRKSEEMKARRNRGSNEAGKDQISRKTESRGAKSNVRSSDSLKIEEQISFSEEELTSKIKGLKLKCEKQRSSVYISRRTPKQSTKSRVNSPRIRAIEEIKKANTKKKKEKSKFSRFAVMKTSFDPHQDFKDSMVEMIVEKGIQRPEELEELLACYLMLNCDEYHDLIIKVFRQVWFKVESTLFSPWAFKYSGNRNRNGNTKQTPPCTSIFALFEQ